MPEPVNAGPPSEPRATLSVAFVWYGAAMAGAANSAVSARAAPVVNNFRMV
jgi:hypothetical protein